METHKLIHIILHIVHEHLLGIAGVHRAPRNEIGLHRLGDLEENLQYRYQHHKGEHIEHCRQQSEHHRQNKILPVGRDKPSQDLKKLLHKPVSFVLCKNTRQRYSFFIINILYLEY